MNVRLIIIDAKSKPIEVVGDKGHQLVYLIEKSVGSDSTGRSFCNDPRELHTECCFCSGSYS